MVLRCMVQHLPCHQSIDRICPEMGCTMATSHDWNLDITQQDGWECRHSGCHTRSGGFSPPPWKIWARQIGSSSQRLGKIKFMFQTTNQICSVYLCWWSNKHRPQTTADLHQRWALQTTASPQKKHIETPTFREAKLRRYGHPVDVHQFLDARSSSFVLGLPTRLSPHFRQNSASGINLRGTIISSDQRWSEVFTADEETCSPIMLASGELR